MREAFLKRIKRNLQRAYLPAASPEHSGTFRGYSFQADAPAAPMIKSFAHELGLLSGHVHVLDDTESVVATILQILQKHEARQIMAWDERNLGLAGLPGALAAAGITMTHHHLSDEANARKAALSELEGIKVGLTGAQAGLADTGSLVVMSGPGRGRLASLLPPVHIALLSAQKLYPSLPAFLAQNPAAATAGSNLVFITGPSRTADIELTLSMGVHGPKEIHAIIFPG